MISAIRELIAAVARFVDYWDSMAAALVAVPFATAAIMFPWLQERARQRRRLAAAKATLPLTLSEIAQYAEDSAERMASSRTAVGMTQVAAKAFKKPRVPDGLVESIQATIEATGNQRIIRRLAKMVRNIQVMDARMTNFSVNRPLSDMVDSTILIAATVYAQASSLFTFAEADKRVEIAELEWSRVTGGLLVMKIYEHQYQYLYGLIANSEAKGRLPEDPLNIHPSTVMIRKLVRRKTTASTA